MRNTRMSIFKKTLILIISILSLLLFSGCNKTISISNIKNGLLMNLPAVRKRKSRIGIKKLLNLTKQSLKKYRGYI